MSSNEWVQIAAARSRLGNRRTFNCKDNLSPGIDFPAEISFHHGRLSEVERNRPYRSKKQLKSETGDTSRPHGIYFIRSHLHMLTVSNNVLSLVEGFYNC